ncbi:hypothetical protein OUZ56_004947 [Daphnia magna]|uniref:Uncharacterized protein n=1 Tax=Daphnia magna TaxID=35525 RepID=A0ABQ9YRB5_9CRUS|nr:hypothetical protein OUZ56_004947 [Daphnia magna]
MSRTTQLKREKRVEAENCFDTNLFTCPGFLVKQPTNCSRLSQKKEEDDHQPYGPPRYCVVWLRWNVNDCPPIIGQNQVGDYPLG